MATSNLLRTGEKGPVTKGHGTGALGPSDTSDSGSDIRGGPGVVEESELGLDSGTSSDPGGGSHRTALTAVCGWFLVRRLFAQCADFQPGAGGKN